ncbi:MAG: hypothetical protein WKG03_03880 [Telluria sp.]
MTLMIRILSAAALSLAMLPVLAQGAPVTPPAPAPMDHVAWSPRPTSWACA